MRFFGWQGERALHIPGGPSLQVAHGDQNLITKGPLELLSKTNEQLKKAERSNFGQ